MLGQAVVTLNDNQWNVWVASTYTELVTGLSGVPSIVSGTGMLFVLGAKRQVTVDTSQMNFPIDIIFISESLVVDVASNIQPGYLVTEETPCDMFLEVNAGEAEGVESGDTVSTVTIQQPGFDFSQIMSFAIPVAALGFVCAMAGGMAGLMGGSSHNSLGHSSKPEEATFPPEARKDPTFCKHMWDLEKTLGRPFTKEEVTKRWENWKELRYRSKTEEERRLTHELKYGTEELPDRGKGLEEYHSSAYSWMITDPETGEILIKEDYSTEDKAKTAAKAFALRRAKYAGEHTVSLRIYSISPDIANLAKGLVFEGRIDIPGGEIVAEHHSMWLTLEQRKSLQEKYGAVAVRWAEEATKPGDIEAADKAAAYYYGRIREYFALGHGSPELTEEQIMKLREVLELTPDVAEILKIHREKGYVQ